MNDQRMMDLSVLEEILAAQERSLSWLSSYKGEGTLGENGPYMQMRQAIDKLRAIIDGPGVEPVVTILTPDPYDEREGPWFDLEGLAKLRKLPSGTKLYLAACGGHGQDNKQGTSVANDKGKQEQTR